MLTGEGYVVINQRNAHADLAAVIEEALERVGKLDWRLYDFTIQPVRSLEHAGFWGGSNKAEARRSRRIPK